MIVIVCFSIEGVPVLTSNPVLSVQGGWLDTNDLGFDYEHRFVLVPIDDTSYYLADLTYKQFGKEDEVLNKLYDDGYQKIDNDKYNYYLHKVTGSNKDITIDESLFKETKGLGK